MQQRSRVLLTPGSHCSSLSTSLGCPRTHTSHHAVMAKEPREHKNVTGDHEDLQSVRAAMASINMSKKRTMTWNAGQPIVFSPVRPNTHDYTWDRSYSIRFSNDRARNYSDRVPVPRRPPSTYRSSSPRSNATFIDPTSKNAFSERPSTTPLVRAPDVQARIALEKEVESLKAKINALEVEQKTRAEQHEIGSGKVLEGRIKEKTLQIQMAETQRVDAQVSALKAEAARSAQWHESMKGTLAKEREKMAKERTCLQGNLTTLREKQASLVALETKYNQEQKLQTEKVAEEQAALEKRRSQRTVYADYRQIFDESDRLIDILIKNPVNDDRYREQYWKRARETFDRFRKKHSATWLDTKYAGFVDSISQFIKTRADMVSRSGKNSPLSSLTDLHRHAQMEAHVSRSMTWTVRFETITGTKNPRLTETIRNAQNFLTTVPIKLTLRRLVSRQDMLDSMLRSEAASYDGEEDALRKEIKQTGDQIELIKILLPHLSSEVDRHSHTRTRQLPPAHRVISLDTWEIRQIQSSTQGKLKTAQEYLRKAIKTKRLPDQLNPTFHLRDRNTKIQHAIVNNVMRLRLAQASRGLLPESDVRAADAFLASATRSKHHRQTKDNLISHFTSATKTPEDEEGTSGNEESSPVYERVDEDESILRIAKVLSKQELVTAHPHLATRLETFITRFETSNHEAALSEAVRTYGRSTLMQKLEQALTIKDPTKFGPMRTTLSTAFRTISRTFKGSERTARGAEIETERLAAPKPRITRYEPKPNSSMRIHRVPQRRAFSSIPRARSEIRLVSPDCGNRNEDVPFPTTLYTEGSQQHEDIKGRSDPVSYPVIRDVGWCNYQPPNSIALSTDSESVSEYEDASEYLEPSAAPAAVECASPDGENDGGGRPRSTGQGGHGDDDDPKNVLDFQIPLQTLRAALTASPNSAGAFWKHTMYKSSTGKPIRLHYCRRYSDAEKVMSHFLHDPVIGFDMEWESTVPIQGNNIKKNISLIQIANEDRIALFHIALFEGNNADELMPQSLRHILESPNVLKTGVNIANDFTRLRKCLKIDGQGIFELSHLYKVVKYSDGHRHLINKNVLSLATQVQNILHLPLKKDAVRMSAWSKKLDMEQCEYAATDAYAGFRLYHALEATRKTMVPMPPRPALHELGKPLVLGDGTEVIPGTKTKPRSKTRAAEIQDKNGDATV